MATIVIPNFNTQKCVDGLNSYQYTVQSAANHTCRIEVDHREASTMTVSIVQAGSVNATLVTATLPGSTTTSGNAHSSLILQAMAVCQPSDTLTFVLTSSAGIDQNLNTVKARLNIHVGGIN
jgi:hypothetical protein